MAKPRRQYTLPLEVDEAIKRYADRYTNGNESKAVEELIQQGREAMRTQTVKGMAYAAVGATTILVLLVLGL